MNRRNFLKLVGTAVLAPALPSLPAAATPKPKPVVARELGPICNCPRCKSRRALETWLREKIDGDMIAALSGLRAA